MSSPSQPTKSDASVSASFLLTRSMRALDGGFPSAVRAAHQTWRASFRRPGVALAKTVIGPGSVGCVCLSQAPNNRRELAEVIEESQRGKHCLVIDLHIEMDKQIALPSCVAKPPGNLG